MDLLCVPEDPSIPVEKTPYVCRGQWDGGPFRSYAARTVSLTRIPPDLRHGCSASQRKEPYTEFLYPTPREDQESFYQTWFFFGLLAEFLGLNEAEDGSRIVEKDEALREIDGLYSAFVRVDGSDGMKYVVGSERPALGPRMIERARAAKPDVQTRMAQLVECLALTHWMLHSIHTPDFTPVIRYSIAALGEMFSSALNMSVVNLQSAGREYSGRLAYFPWVREFLRPGSELERLMIAEKGWCPSEVEKIRTQYLGLNTVYFLTRMKRPEPYRDHSGCTRDQCVGSQLQMETYRPAHAPECRACENVKVNIKEVIRILMETETYPVLNVTFPQGGKEKMEVHVEAYEPGTPFVALSHVWADGLGNPTENSLPECQIARVANLIHTLSDSQKPSAEEEEEGKTYRIWIDPLCCPVEKESKKVSLERIADVYRDATHVLVLDRSISRYPSETTHPAELLLRIFGTSAWMGRLWTLQEGALARSLLFQFSDRAVQSVDLLSQLFQQACKDSRWMQVWRDLAAEFQRLHSFFGSSTGASRGLKITPPDLRTLQRALNQRTVSVPSDEPLCITTLLGLNMRHVAAVDDAQERMARVWELIALKDHGVPSRVLFFVDNPIDLPGWRWAPRSLLSSGRGKSAMDMSSQVDWFGGSGTPPPGQPGAGATVGGQRQGPPPGESELAIPTRWGLQVRRFPGYLVQVRPLVDGLPLHPWEGMARRREDQLILRDQKGKWYKVIEWYRSQNVATWTTEERRAYDDKADMPLCRAMDGGKAAMILDRPHPHRDMRHARLVEVKESQEMEEYDTREGQKHDDVQGIPVRGVKTVIISALEEGEVLVFETLRRLAEVVAKEAVTRDMCAIADQSSQAYADATEKAKDRMRGLVAETWAAKPEFVKAVHDSFGADLAESMWVSIPKYCSHNIVATELPSDQYWIVD